MRRLIVLVAIVVLTGAMLASAAFLDVDGGALQTFRFDVDIDAPAEVSCVDDVADCEDREQPTDAEDTPSNDEEAGPSLSSTTTTEGSTSTTSPPTVTTHTTEVTIKVETTVTSQPPDSGAVDLP